MSFDLEKCLRGSRNVTQSVALVADEEHRKTALRAYEAYGRATMAGAPPETCIPEIVAAAKCPNSCVSFHAGNLLNLLAFDHEAAREAIRELMRTGDRSGRFVAIAAIRSPRKLPAEFAEEIFRAGLEDPLVDTKKSAACAVWQYGGKLLVPEMITMRGTLTDPNDRDWVDLYIDLARDGYSVDDPIAEQVAGMRNPDGSPCVEEMCTIRVRCEHPSGVSLIGGSVRRRDIDSTGAAKVAEGMCERWLVDQERRRAQDRVGKDAC